MGFFRNEDGDKEAGYLSQDWEDLETGWGKSKYVGRSIGDFIVVAIGVGFFIYFFFLLIGTGN